MLKPRIPETNEGIQNAVTVEVFDRFAKYMRDRGISNVDAFLGAGIGTGNILEIGPGPGYVGLELLKKAPDAALTGCEISPEMIKMAQKNAKEYGFAQRTRYVEGNGMHMPFADASFDGVFSNGSLHEWEDPVSVFNEIYRVLKPNGVVCIADMRRDSHPALNWIAYHTAKPREIRPGFLTSLHAAYTVEELRALVQRSALASAEVNREVFGLFITGRKGL